MAHLWPKLFNASHNTEDKIQTLAITFKGLPWSDSNLFFETFLLLYYNEAHEFLTLLYYSLFSQHNISSCGLLNGKFSPSTFHSHLSKSYPSFKDLHKCHILPETFPKHKIRIKSFLLCRNINTPFLYLYFSVITLCGGWIQNIIYEAKTSNSKCYFWKSHVKLLLNMAISPYNKFTTMDFPSSIKTNCLSSVEY